MKILNPSDFGTMNPISLFSRMVIPTLLSLGTYALISVIETMFLGQFGGGFELAILNIGMPVVFIIFALSGIVAVGASTLTSIKLGKGEKSDANRIFTHSLLLLIGAGILFGILIILFGEQFLSIMGVSSDSIHQSYIFLIPFAIVCPLMNLLSPFICYLKVCGRPEWLFVSTILVSVLSLGLDVLFIIYLNMGAMGYAYSKAIAFSVTVLFEALPFLLHKVALKFELRKLPIKTYGKILYLGVPMLTTSLTFTLITIGVNAILMNIWGTEAVAVFTIILAVMPLAYALFFGISDGIQQVISYCYGKKDWGRLFCLNKIALIVGTVISVLVLLFILIFNENIVHLFLNDSEPLLIQSTIAALFIYAFVCLFKWFAINISSFFIAVEKPITSLVFNLFESFIFPALCLLILFPLFGFYGIWVAFVVAELLSAIFAGILYVNIGRKHNWGKSISPC